MSAPTPVTIDDLPTLTIGPPGSGSLNTASSIDPANDYVPIYQKSSTSTLAINRNTLLNLGSQPVGISDTQTLTNKTLTSPTINGATLSGTLSGTYTIGGTPTFPSSVATLTGTQTLTNKTLTSPTINSPTITNATISADTITGYTTSDSGTIYGIPVTTGVINTASTVNGASLVSASVSSSALASSSVTTAAIATNAVTAPKLATSAITLGYAQITSTFTTTSTSYTLITGLSVNVTIPAGGRNVKITVYSASISNSSSPDAVNVAIFSGATSGALTTQIGQLGITEETANYVFPCCCVTVLRAPSAGSIYYSAAMLVQAGTGSFVAGASYPGFILVEMI